MTELPQVSVTSILNDIRRKFDTSEFERGYITSILGSADMDLRNAKIKESEATLEITNVLGSVYIYTPSEWSVSLEITEIAGRVKDRRTDLPKGKSAKKMLRIIGITVLGDVYIR